MRNISSNFISDRKCNLLRSCCSAYKSYVVIRSKCGKFKWTFVRYNGNVQNFFFFTFSSTLMYNNGKEILHSVQVRYLLMLFSVINCLLLFYYFLNSRVEDSVNKIIWLRCNRESWKAIKYFFIYIWKKQNRCLSEKLFKLMLTANCLPKIDVKLRSGVGRYSR